MGTAGTTFHLAAALAVVAVNGAVLMLSAVGRQNQFWQRDWWHQ